METAPNDVAPSYPKPSLTVDCVVRDSGGRVLLIQRARPPFKERWALPGGFVDPGETVEQAARRELLEETSVRAGRLRLIDVFSQPGRDPRGWVVSVAYLVLDWTGEVSAQDDAKAACFKEITDDLEIAFDHSEIIRRAIEISRQTP